ncbi:MAG: 2-phospho-L-lactate guanylyltransferase [Actinomycetota bacterium]|nr:2-phospho-L-lactate guanylyltransferase [Actinomycetota bacterium]
MPTPFAIIPLKDFREAKGRLDLPGELRSSLAQAVAGHVINACGDAGFEPLVVTGSARLQQWAGALGAGSLDEPPGGGLDAAAGQGIAAARRLEVPWLVVHGDLPLLDAMDLHPLLTPLHEGALVIAPSRDGGTNLLGSVGPFEFRYGPASFHRHLARAAGRPVHVVVSPGTALEIDTLPDLHAVALLAAGGWLRRFLS